MESLDTGVAYSDIYFVLITQVALLKKDCGGVRRGKMEGQLRGNCSNLGCLDQISGNGHGEKWLNSRQILTV